MQNTARIDQIIVAENRQRKQFDAAGITKLAESIQRNGLLHPVVCRQDDAGIFLVAGERRLRALTQNFQLDIGTKCAGTMHPSGIVPITLITNLSPEAAFEAELEENVSRIDLTWQERASAEAQLHALRGGTLRDTASEILGHLAQGSEISSLSDNVIIAKHLDDPDVAKAASKKEAMKIVQKKATVAHRAELAKTFDTTQTPHILHHGDCTEFLQTIPSSSVDILLTDPPYGMDADKFSSNFDIAHEYADSWERFEVLAAMLAEESFRICKDDAHAYVFCTYDGFHQLRNEFTTYGWKVFPQPLIWSKGGGNSPWIEYGPSRAYECILYAMKGKKKCISVKPDVISIPKVQDREHGAEKPVALFAELLSRSATPGDTVLDPFCGSGTIFPAASLTHCLAIGCEISQDYYNLALERMVKDDTLNI